MVRSQQTCSNAGEMSYEERQHHRMQVVYARQMHERRVFLDELTAVRRKREKETLKYVLRLIGPKWYQVLSVNQRQSLDTLTFCIQKDLLEGTPVRTLTVLKSLGLHPRPNKIDLMNCIYLGRDDPKEMLAELYLYTYGNHFDLMEPEYCLNAKLILSSIYYLGLHSLINLLKERFKPEPQKKKCSVKRGSKVTKFPAISPYLERMTAAYYETPKKKRSGPAPLPNLDDLNEPWEPKPCKPKLPPPPPPPPPPKKRIPQAYCEKLAGIVTIEPYTPATDVKVQGQRKTFNHSIAQAPRKRAKMFLLPDEKKNYGVGSTAGGSRRHRVKKPLVPTTALSSMQFMISGVFRIHGKNVYVLGNVTAIPPAGNLLHCGHKSVQGENIIIHGGYTADEPLPLPAPCDCVQQWTGTVLKYVRRTKCYCDHNYDYGNEGHFSKNELAFFQKPTSYTPPHFNLDTIFSMDPKTNYVQKKFKKLWSTDSILNNGKLGETKKSKRMASNNCLGDNPRPEDYLRCALRYMQDENIAAKLPNIHLAPELKEWMHRRIYGPYSRAEKKALIRKSMVLWKLLELITKKGLGRIRMPKDPAFEGESNWCHKEELNIKFRKYTQLYRSKLYEAQANVTNMFWPTMFQDKFPDKHFREVFFSYVFAKIDDVQLMHPFTLREAMLRYDAFVNKPYCCLPDGVQDYKK